MGVVGAGWAAQEHGRSLAALSEPAPVVVTDVDPARATRLAAQWGAAVAADLDELLTHALDAVIVSTPAGAHAAALLPLLARGVPVFVEKPLALTPADADAVVTAAAGIPVAVGYQWRAVPVLSDLDRELDGQSVALILSQGVGITQARSWFTDPSLAAGLLGERGSHHLDLLDRLGGPIRAVRAVHGPVRVSGAAPVGGADVLTVTCRHDGGAVSVSSVVWASADHLPEQSARVVSSAGHYHLSLDPEFRLRGRTGTRPVDAAGGRAPFRRQLHRFLAAVRNGTPDAVFCTPAQAAATVSVVEAAARSLGSGSEVDVPTARG